MQCVTVWDDAQASDHAYNLFACKSCGRICKEDVWNDPGLRWVALDGTLTLEPRMSKDVLPDGTEIVVTTQDLHAARGDEVAHGMKVYADNGDGTHRRVAPEDWPPPDRIRPLH